MPTILERYTAATVKAEAASDKGHEWIHGADNETVTTEGGEVPTIAKITKDAQDLITEQVGDLAGAVASAEEDAVATAADRVQTAADRVQTGLDRVQTGQDATATAADRVQTGLDRTAVNADKLAADADAVATAADRVQTGLDVTASGNSAITATTQAGIATTQAGISTAQAVISTTKAVEAAASAALASSVVLANVAPHLSGRATRPGIKSEGTSNAGTTQDNTGLAFGTGDLTIGMWVRLPDFTPTAEMQLLSKYVSGLGVILALRPTGEVRLYIGNGAGSTTAFTTSVATGLTDGAWAFLSVSIDADGNAIVYVNGAALGTALNVSALSAQTRTNTNPLYWLSSGSTHYAGTFGESWIINGLLTASEISTIYANGSIASLCTWTYDTTKGQNVATLSGGRAFYTWPDFARADPVNNPIAYDRSGNNQHAILGTSGLTVAVPLTWRNTAPTHAIVSDGSNGSRLYATLNSQNPGTGECEIWWEGVFSLGPTGDGRTLAALTSSISEVVQAKAFSTFYTNSEIGVRLFGATTSDIRQIKSANLAASMAALGARGIWTVFIARRTSAGVRAFLGIGRDASRFYDVTNLFTESTSGAPPAWTDEIDGDYFVGVYRNSTVSSAHPISRLELTNVGRTEAQLRTEYERGEPGPEWVGGSKSAATAGASWSNLTYETFSGASATGFTAVETGSAGSARIGGGYSAYWAAGTIKSGWVFEVAFTLTLNSGTAPSFILRDSSGGTARSAAVVATAGSNRFLVPVTSNFTGSLEPYFDAAAAGDFVVASYGLNKAGYTTRLRTDEGVGYQPKNDAVSSTNDSTHFVASTTGVEWSPKQTRGQLNGILSWSGTHGAQPMTATLPVNAVLERITLKASVATTGGGITVGSTTSATRWLVATPLTTAKKVIPASGLANLVPAGTSSLDLTVQVDPDTANYTGTIDVTIDYVVTNGNP